MKYGIFGWIASVAMGFALLALAPWAAQAQDPVVNVGARAEVEGYVAGIVTLPADAAGNAYLRLSISNAGGSVVTVQACQRVWSAGERVRFDLGDRVRAVGIVTVENGVPMLSSCDIRVLSLAPDYTYRRDYRVVTPYTYGEHRSYTAYYPYTFGFYYPFSSRRHTGVGNFARRDGHRFQRQHVNGEESIGHGIGRGGTVTRTAPRTSRTLGLPTDAPGSRGPLGVSRTRVSSTVTRTAPSTRTRAAVTRTAPSIRTHTAVTRTTPSVRATRRSGMTSSGHVRSRATGVRRAPSRTHGVSQRHAGGRRHR